MKNKLATILLSVLATVGVISLTSSNLSSAPQQGNLRGSTVYVSKDLKSLQVTYKVTSQNLWEPVFQVPITGRGSTWEMSDFQCTKGSANSGLGHTNERFHLRVFRANGLIEPIVGYNPNVVHHHGIILQEGDVLEIFGTYWDPVIYDVFFFASGRYNH